MKNKGKKWLSLITSIVMMAQLCLIALPGTVKAETTSIFTDYLPTITQVSDEAGFTHPGVGLTKDLLENVRTKVRAGAQPWTYYFNSMLLDSSNASKTVTSSNSSDGITPSADYFNSQGIEGRFIADGIKAYTQAFMYYMTGDEVYRANAMMIIRIWGKMDPTKYAYYKDAHIHAGVPLNRMVMAAEILRYTSYQSASLAWADQDTTNFTNNLIVPVTETLLHDQNHFMNQHNYPLLGAMAGYIFTGNRDRYNEAVEWFTVNRTAKDQGLNGSVKALFRLVTEEEKPGIHVGEGTPIDEPHVQQMEMGRDQAHGGGDLTNSAMITRLIHAQGTKVDPVAGTPSTADNAVDVMDFLDNRILGAADYFWHFMLGYDTVWTPQAYAITGGDPDNVGMGGYIRDTYNSLSDGYKGRFLTANFWDFYSYYTYVKHEDVSKIAPYYYEAFTKKLPATSGGWGNVDAGNDFWLYLSPKAEADAAKFIPQNKSAGTIYELADRYTNLTKLDNSKPAVKDNDNKNAIKDTNNIDTSAVTTMTEGDNSFIRFFAKEEGTRIAYLSSGLNTASYEFRIRTNGVATLNTMGKSVSLPDTKGEWKYFPVSGAPFDFDVITVSGASGIIVDIDHINTANLTPPTFKTGNADMKVYTYVGASVNLDFSATDSSNTDVITYGLQNNPVGSAIDSGTGAFSWQPTAGGNISLVVTATDGTTITTKNVNIIVGSDRASAVQAVTAAYNAGAIYEKASLANYQTVYNNTMNMITTASDVDFDKQLQALGTATEGLRLLTPLTPLGSMYWSQVAYWSSWGKDATGLDDASGGGGWYGLALGTPPHLYHLIDFGPDYKISAYRFGFKASIFADRVANSTVYASNDKINWTRITPGVSAYTQAYNTIDVAPEFQNEKYRYIKLEMVQPLPDVLYGVVRNLFEPRGFTIYGTRYDVGNKLQSVSLSSDQSMLNRIALGSTVKASITAKEAIQNVKVKIQGQDATVSTQDNMNWTATAVLTGKGQTGDVKVSVDYQRQDGTNGDTLYGTTDNSKLFVVDDSDLINNVTGITNLIDSTSGRSAATTLQIVNSLFDNNASTGSDFRNGGSGSGWGSYITFDFKEGNAVTLSSVELLANQTFYTRLGGAVVQGSNDNATWTTLTNGAAGIADWQSFAVSDTTPYRYIRIFDGGNWVGNMAEVKFHGAVKHLSKIASASISSAQSIVNRIVPGNTAKLSFTTTEPVSNVNVAIQGQVATVSSPDKINWTAVATLNQGVAAGPVKFAINYNNQDGTVGFPIHTTTDNSTLFLVDESDVIQNVTGITNLIDSTSGRSAATTLQIVNSLFDNNASTGSDFRNGGSGSGWGSYITFDFKEGNAVTLSSVELLANQTFYTRLGGAVVQGSNDNATWTTLTNGAAGIANWQSFAVSDTTPYRYIRLYNPNQWFGNMAEVKFHGNVIITLTPLPPSDYTKGSYYLYQQEFSRIKAAFNLPGADRVLLAAQLKTAEGSLVRIPLSLYSFEGNANNSFGSSTGTVNGTPVYSAGKVGQAISLNGTNSYVQLPQAHPLSTYDAITVSAWVYWNGSSQWQRIFDFGNNTNQYMFLSPKSGSNTLRFAIKNGGSEQIVETSQLAAGQWAHVAVTLGGGTAKLYVNGELKATKSGFMIKPSDIKPNLNYIGKSQFSDPFFNGMIDEFRVDNSVLSADDIKAVYNNTAKWIDKSLLTLLLVKAAAIDVTLYTAETVATLQAIVPTAQSVLANANATQAQIDAVSASLQAALDGLLSPVTATIDPAEPNGLKGWYTVPVTVTLSTYGKAEYSLDGGATWQPYTSAITFDKEGKYTVRYRSTDNTGNVEAVKTIDINLDSTPPVTTAAVSTAAPDGQHGWYVHAVTVSLTADDNLSGIAKMEYSLDGGSTWQSYTAPVTLSQDSKYTVSYRSTDNAGNVEAAKTISFNLDSTAPVTTATPSQPDGANGWYVPQATVSLSATDNLAGVAKTEYSLDGGTTWQPYTSAITFDKEGKYIVSYRSTDNAGNLEMAKSVNINLDSTAPVTTAVVTPAQPDGQHGWYVHPVTVTLSAYDNLSGVGKTEYSLDGGSTWLAYTAPVTLNQDSKYTVGYRSTDNAGNVEAVKTIGFNLDATAPTITVSGLVYGTYNDSMDITPILTLSDNMSGVDSSKTTVTVSTYGVQQTVQQGATIPLYTLPLGSHAFIVTASDLAGNTSSQTVIFQTSTSILSLQALITRFTNMGWIDSTGIANSLQNKLAANDLADFIGEVQAQSGKHISAQAAGFLLRDAQYMLSKQ